MKKYFLFAAMVLTTLAACTSEDLVDSSIADNSLANQAGENVMGFNVKNKNMTRAASSLESKSQYNFGVWAVKQSGTDPYTYQNVMSNYLVGYHSTGVGYALASPQQPTYGESDNLADGLSQWFYDGLGYKEYVHTASDGYYIYDFAGSNTTNEDKMSNNANQYLKYWDYSSNKVDFYAYAPYVKGANTPTYANGKITFPNYGAAGFMVASKEVEKAQYAYDVPLTFKRLGAVVKVKFWEDIPGYDVEMIDYTIGTEEGVVAQGNIISGTGEPYVYDFSTGTGAFTNSLSPASTNIEFAIPAGTEVTNVEANATTGQTEYKKIGSTKGDASASATEYGAVPTPSGNGDLTFHVSFTLRSLDTDEVITVTDATATVIDDYTAWASNTVYTYIFKITKDANGSTGTGSDPKGLYPIVFDDIQISDYETNESDWIISQVSMDPQLLTLASGSTKTITANMNYVEKDGLVYDFGWVSDQTDVATVTGNADANASNMKCTATVTGVAAGTAIITATNNGHSATCRVTVPLTLSDATVVAGSTVTPTNNLPNPLSAGASVAWTSSDTSVATVVESTGVVTGVAEGTTTITCTYTDAKGVVQVRTCVVTVTAS